MSVNITSQDKFSFLTKVSQAKFSCDSWTSSGKIIVIKLV